MSYEIEYNEWKMIQLNIGQKIDEIIWNKKYTSVLKNDDDKSWTWFPDGELNIVIIV